MEIERKFAIDGFPENMEPVSTVFIEQSYLSLVPEVRIRRCTLPDGTREYVMTVKGEGKLAREEIEVGLTAEQYDGMRRLISEEPVTKDYRAYRIENGLTLECSLVDKGRDTSFYYAEVEFESVDDAESFVPPEYLGRELTYEKNAGMRAYYIRTRIQPKK